MAPVLLTTRSIPARSFRVAATKVQVDATPVALDPRDPMRVRIGRLTYAEGWSLATRQRSGFGGLSAIRVAGERITAISDIGAIVRFRLTRFGHIAEARIDPLPDRCGVPSEGRDSEALTIDRASGTLWTALEWHNMVCRIDPDGRVKTVAPLAMRHWARNFGPETLLRLPDGRFIAIAEHDPAAGIDGGETRPLLVFDRDPTDPSVRVTQLRYRPPPGFSPTDAAVLPDGRLVTINRGFGLPDLFTATIAIADIADLAPGRTVTAHAIATFRPPLLSDNFEGIDVDQVAGRTRLTIVSDDNFASWQRTLLLRFWLD